jgi:hypothetical protein
MREIEFRGKSTKRFCPVCGKEFYPRIADIKRGWGKFCSKRCKAIKQKEGKYIGATRIKHTYRWKKIYFIFQHGIGLRNNNEILYI